MRGLDRCRDRVPGGGMNRPVSMRAAGEQASQRLRRSAARPLISRAVSRARSVQGSTKRALTRRMVPSPVRPPNCRVKWGVRSVSDTSEQPNSRLAGALRGESMIRQVMTGQRCRGRSGCANLAQAPAPASAARWAGAPLTSPDRCRGGLCAPIRWGHGTLSGVRRHIEVGLTMKGKALSRPQDPSVVARRFRALESLLSAVV